MSTPTTDWRNPDERYIIAAVAAREVGVTPTSVRRWIESGRISGQRHGHWWLLERTDLPKLKALAAGRPPVGRPRTTDAEPRRDPSFIERWTKRAPSACLCLIGEYCPHLETPPGKRGPLAIFERARRTPFVGSVAEAEDLMPEVDIPA